MTQEKQKAMNSREVLTVLMQIESMHMQVHESRIILIGERPKPSEGIRGIGELVIAADFKTIEVLGECCNRWTLNTVDHAEYDEIEDILYLRFKHPNEV